MGGVADLSLWDPVRHETLQQDILHHGTPDEGCAMTGWSVRTMLRGETLVF